MDHAISELRPPDIQLREHRRYQLGPREIVLAELTALDADDIWQQLGEAEKTGKIIEAYVQVVCRGACDHELRPIFDAEAARRLPARLVVEMAEVIMELTGLGLDSGKDGAGEAETPS